MDNFTYIFLQDMQSLRGNLHSLTRYFEISSPYKVRMGRALKEAGAALDFAAHALHESLNP